MLSRLVLAALLPLVAGCATVTRGTTSHVGFTSSPSGAEMRTSTGLSCITPCDLEIPRRQEFTAVFTHGGERRELRVTTRVAGEGAAGLAGNILIGGLIGAAVDVSTGATLEHVPNPVHVSFTPAADAAPVADAAPAADARPAQAPATAPGS
ncbi:MAG: hypothetical protein KatS3mg118_3662 [Paracoccaceae bacterium]|nr:MAG: hypothetical protein KatS3mg118_3662 [Paracoccaceae bacterium]